MTEAGHAIDALRDEAGQLDREAIRQILPYGDDFLFVDHVSSLTPSQVEATYTIPEHASFVRSHIIGLPLMPGALICEGMAQAGTLIVRYRLEPNKEMDFLAFQIERARFLSPAQPGERLTFRVRLLNLRLQAARLQGEVSVRERAVCRARIVLGIMDRPTLTTQLRQLRES